MKQKANILWVALTTFVMGYVVSALTQSGHAHSGAPAIIRIARPEANASAPTSAGIARARKAHFTDTALPESFTHGRSNGLNRPEALTPFFNLLDRHARPVRVLHLGDSHVAGKTFPEKVRQTLYEVWGQADSTHTGITYTFMGRNGATTAHFANYERMQQIAAANPDLIILSFGTNECHGMGYDEARHTAQLETFFDLLGTACPQAVIMLTTPPGDCIAQRTVGYVTRNGRRRRIVRRHNRTNPMTVRCAANIEQFAADRHLAVWDLNTIAGGDQAVSAWQRSGMMRPDRIHYTPEGYSLQGRLLGEAILMAYNDYADRTVAP